MWFFVNGAREFWLFVKSTFSYPSKLTRTFLNKTGYISTEKSEENAQVLESDRYEFEL